MATVKYLDENGLSTVWSKVKGIVTPKADKVSGATNGHLAGLNSSGNLTDSGLAATNVAQKDGSYSGMTVGTAEDLVSAESVASEFTSRITGGSTAVGKGGTALVDKIKGRTLVWNQLVQNGNFANGTTGWTQDNSTISESNGELTIEKSSGSASTGGFARTSITGDPTHKYYMACDAEMLTSGVELYLGFHTTGGTVGGNAMASTVSSSYTRISQIASPISKTDTFSVRVGAAASPANSTGKIKNVILIDLTLMFGGNEPSTPEEFEALYPGPYYDYNNGTPINNAAAAIETVGWNQWDEEVEEGGFDQYGVPVSGGARLRAKNFIEVFPNTDYYVCMTGTHTTQERVVRVVWYDDAKNVVLVTDNAYLQYSVTSPANAKFAKFHIGQAYGTAYKGDICISLSDPSRNGTYEPYWRSELDLGLGDIKVKSHNLWDEETETGTINHTTGAKETSSYAQIRSKNYIPCSPNATYYIKSPSGDSGYVYMHFYDSEHNFISGSERRNTTVIAPANASYILLSFNTNYGTTYANDICINLSDPSFNGRYEPYGDGGVISITGGLKSAGAVYDEIGGGKLVKRLESVGLSTLASWSAYDTANSRYNATVSDMRIAAARVAAALIPINNDYFTYQGRIYIETTNSDRTSFIASLAGVHLYYELAQPIEYELAEAIPTAMRNDPYGTERRLPEDTAGTVLAPFRADITYSTNIKEAVQSLPQNYININSMQDFLAALGALMGGTWTMRPADGKFDFTFTPNPSNE